MIHQRRVGLLMRGGGDLPEAELFEDFGDYCWVHSGVALASLGSKSGSLSLPSSSSSSSGTWGGSKKLKKLSAFTCFVMVLTFPLFLCFCFFFTVFTVRFLSFFQSIEQPLHLNI